MNPNPECDERLRQIREIVNGPNFYKDGSFYTSSHGQRKYLGDALLLLKETFALLDSRAVKENKDGVKESV